MKKCLKCILIIIGIIVGIVVLLAIIDLRKRYELPFEREELDSFSILYASSCVVTDIYTFNKPEECEMIMDFFDSLEPTGRSLSENVDVSACAVTFHLKDGTEEHVTILETGRQYSFENGKDEYIWMRSKMSLRDMFPEETSVKILVNGTMYYWDQEAHLPIEYKEHSTILETINGTPTKDCQMSARYDATGTIYTSDLTPDAIYVKLSIDGAKAFYVRFITEELAAGPSIVWNGKSYSAEIYSGLNETLEELPDTCEYVGGLHVIHKDAIPENNLETNCQKDMYDCTLRGREVYFDPNDPDYIYMYQKLIGRGGEYDTYIKLPVLQ